MSERIDALDTCNSCDGLGVDPGSLAGYCADCEREAQAERIEWIVVRRRGNGRGVEVARFDTMSKAVREATDRDEGRDYDDPYHQVRRAI